MATLYSAYRYSTLTDANAPQSEREQALSDASYDQWVTQYHLRDKVHCQFDLRHELDDPTVVPICVTDWPVTDTGIYRRHDIYLTLMSALCK